MNMLIENLDLVGQHWVAWLVIALILLAAGGGAIHMMRCPHIRGTAQVDPHDAASRVGQPVVAGIGYFLVMLAGIAAIMVALSMMAQGMTPVAAFAVLAAGIVVVQIAPVILRLRESYDRVIAAQLQGPEAVAFARERLRNLHTAGILLCVGIALLLALGLLAF